MAKDWMSGTGTRVQATTLKEITSVTACAVITVILYSEHPHQGLGEVSLSVWARASVPRDDQVHLSLFGGGSGPTAVSGVVHHIVVGLELGALECQAHCLLLSAVFWVSLAGILERVVMKDAEGEDLSDRNMGEVSFEGTRRGLFS